MTSQAWQAASQTDSVRLSPRPLTAGMRRLSGRRMSTGCLNVVCVQCENGKSICPIDNARRPKPTMAHDAETDSDLARSPDGKHPSAAIQRGTLRRLCYCGVLRSGAPPAMLWRTRVLVTLSEVTVERWMGAARTTRDRGGARMRRTGPNRRRAGAGGPGADSGRRRLSGMLAEHSLIG